MPGTKKNFFLMRLFSSSKNRGNIVWRSCPPSQSIGRGRISREGALDHRESRERRDKIFAAKTENAKIFNKKYWIRKTVFSGEFSFFSPALTPRTTLLGAGVYVLVVDFRVSFRLFAYFYCYIKKCSVECYIFSDFLRSFRKLLR